MPQPGEDEVDTRDRWERSKERSRRRRRIGRARRVRRRRGSHLGLGLVVATLAATGLAVAHERSTTSPDPSPPGQVLERGSHGATVEALQRALGIGPDGVFGPQTAAAVRHYQWHRALVVDGIVGPQTSAALGLATSSSAPHEHGDTDGAPSRAGRPGGLGWPVSGPITTAFDGGHAGIDIAASMGTSIRVAAGGTVTVKGTAQSGGYGNDTCVAHGGGPSTCYAHQAQITVQPGSRVASGQSIGTVGCTGRCSGPHLHFEVRRGGAPTNPVGLLGG